MSIRNRIDCRSWIVERLLCSLERYTLTFLKDTNEMISYATTGTEDLPNEEGELEPVTMAQYELRTGYTTVDPTTWAEGFFNSTASCFFEGSVVHPQGSERNECAPPHGANASAGGDATTGAVGSTSAAPGSCDCPACPGGSSGQGKDKSSGKGSGDDDANGVEIGTLVLIIFVAIGLAAACIVYAYRHRQARLQAPYTRSGLAATSNSAYSSHA